MGNELKATNGPRGLDGVIAMIHRVISADEREREAGEALIRFINQLRDDPEMQHIIIGNIYGVITFRDPSKGITVCASVPEYPKILLWGEDINEVPIPNTRGLVAESEAVNRLRQLLS